MPMLATRGLRVWEWEAVSPGAIPGTKQTGRDWRTQVVMAIACRREECLSEEAGVERVNDRTGRCGRRRSTAKR